MDRQGTEAWLAILYWLASFRLVRSPVSKKKKRYKVPEVDTWTPLAHIHMCTYMCMSP